MTLADPRTVDWGGRDVTSPGIAKMLRLVDQLAPLSAGTVGWYGPSTFTVCDRSALKSCYAFGVDSAKERDRQYIVFKPAPKRPFLWRPS